MAFIKFLCLAFLGVVLFVDEGSSTLHGDFCSDISIFDDIEYKTSNKRCCDTKMRKKCEQKTEERCEDVTELKCEVVGIPHCSPKPKRIGGLKKCTPVFQDFDMRDCEEVKEAVKHKKKLPECKKVTKNNCLTDWNVDENGNKVWAGTEKCTPVTWEECAIVEKEVDFPTVRTECGVVGNIKWNTFEETDGGNEEHMEITCEIKADLDCKPVTSRSCATVDYDECKMEANHDCRDVTIHEPTQPKKHLKKCLT